MEAAFAIVGNLIEVVDGVVVVVLLESVVEGVELVGVIRFFDELIEIIVSIVVFDSAKRVMKLVGEEIADGIIAHLGLKVGGFCLNPAGEGVSGDGEEAELGREFCLHEKSIECAVFVGVGLAFAADLVKISPLIGVGDG